MAKNPFYQSIQETVGNYQSLLDGYDIEEQALDPTAMQMDGILGDFYLITKTSAFKVIHPLFIKFYRERSMHFQQTPIETVGLDVETDAKTGAPKLIGFMLPDGTYQYIYKPTVATIFEYIKSVAEAGHNLVTWGKFDIQIMIRIFQPDEKERQRISRGISANPRQNIFPCVRIVGKYQFYIANYIPGRSLKLGYKDGEYARSVWIFNISQFFPGTIEQTAKAINYKWEAFAKTTHLVDWQLFESNIHYQKSVLESNKQDADAVRYFSQHLQETFYGVFRAYPKVLVSAGSLVDAAVSKMLDKSDDYAANAFIWLARNIWNEIPETVRFLEPLLSECFSAGYVDQFALGYFPKVCTADISSAYPFIIRSLPDLRYSYLVEGSDITVLKKIRESMDVETVFFRGMVTIPPNLHFHPITIKTSNRENYRPIGTFWAAYTWEEREFCVKHGATFEYEDWCAIVLKDRKPAPIALVSERLGEMRNQITKDRDSFSKQSSNYKFLDGQQYIVKVIDNSIYGKTVMTTEVIEDVEGEPSITGYVAGDRFNLLYGTIITSRTRVSIASALMTIEKNGGRPIMAMTDSVYWYGSVNMLPAEWCKQEKTPGYFEIPHEITEFYILKTGQYEYIENEEWNYKLRGLPVESEFINGRFYPIITHKGTVSLLRKAVKDQTKHQIAWKHPKDVHVILDTRRLHTIGQRNIDIVGLIETEQTNIAPFVLSSKQTERYILNWKQAIDDHIWLEFPIIKDQDSAASQTPLLFLNDQYKERQHDVAVNKAQKRITSRKIKNRVAYYRRKLFVYKATIATDKAPMPDWDKKSWRQLYEYYGITRDDLK